MSETEKPKKTDVAKPPAKSDAEKLHDMEVSFASKLPGAVDGALVTRFPPEPSGYLHVGHAKAALINAFYARHFHGRLLIRFDDTNPTKEKAEFEQSITEDLALLGVKGEGPSYTSDYFDQLQESMESMIKMGKAYVDDTATDVMRDERFKGIESKCRSLPLEENLRRWQAMKEGTEEGQTMCVRAKINMQDKNKALRDPVMYRVNVNTPHHRTGSKYKVYPCYDFACPLVDSWSGVTHALRTNEYADRIPQYYWVQDTMGVRRTIIYEFSRLNFTNTVLSKRKLQWLVDTGVVSGWDDPRFPTVRGMLRRGLRVDALHEFLIEQGPSKNGNLMEWDKLWSKNQRLLDPISKRFMAVAADAVPFVMEDLTLGSINKKRPLHPKKPEMGEIDLCVTPTVYVEREDATACEDGEEITLMRMGNAIIKKVERDAEGNAVKLIGCSHLEGDVKKTKKKLHWVPSDSERFGETVKVVLREYDHIITKKKPEEGDSMEDIVNRDSVFDTMCIAEPGVASLVEGDVVQLERRGYIRVDRPLEDGTPVYIAIPSGKMKAMSKLSTKVDAATLSRGGNH